MEFLVMKVVRVNPFFKALSRGALSLKFPSNQNKTPSPLSPSKREEQIVS